MADASMIAAIATALATAGDKRPRAPEDCPVTRAEYDALVLKVACLEQAGASLADRVANLEAGSRAETQTPAEAQAAADAYLCVQIYHLALICGAGTNTQRVALGSTAQQVAADLSTHSPQLDAILSQVDCSRSQWSEILRNSTAVSQGERAIKNFKARVFGRPATVEDPFFGMTAEQILDDLPAMRMNLGTNALNYAIRCATVGFDRLLAQLSANAAIRSNVSCKRAALEFASLRSVTLAALGQSEAYKKYSAMKKKAKPQTAASETHERIAAKWDELFEAVNAVVQRGIDSALTKVLERVSEV